MAGIKDVRGKTELAGRKLWVNGWTKDPHPYRIVRGDISEYTLIGYRKKGYKDVYSIPVNVTFMRGDQVGLDFVMVTAPLHLHSVETVPTKVISSKTGTLLPKKTRRKK